MRRQQPAQPVPLPRSRASSQPPNEGYAEKAKRLFARFDVNKDGRVSQQELAQVLAADPRLRKDLGWPGTADELVLLLARDGQGDFSESRMRHFCEVQALFQKIDANSSGRISAWELETALRTHADVRSKLGVPARLSNSLFSQMDTNATGSITLVDFYRYFTAAPLSRPYRPLGDHQAIAQRLFRRIDRDGSGGISRAEFAEALRSDPEVQLDLGQPASHADQLFNFLDSDRNGHVCERELRLFCRAQWIFNGIDVNRSGYIDLYELGTALADRALQRELGCSAAQAQQLFKEIDSRRSGMIKFTDFYRWLEQQPERSSGKGDRELPESPPAGGAAAPTTGASAYEGHKLLCEGSFGRVLKVKRRCDGLVLILKEPKPEAGVTLEEARTEAQIMARLKHQNIVRFVDSYIDGGKLCIVTEYCAGGDLRRYQGGRPLPPEVGIRIWEEMLRGMKYLHERGVLHRDMKPDNILLTETRSAKITDFGLAKQETPKAGATVVAMTYCGTPFYMSPEVHENNPYGKANDVWGLGCILYEMGTGKLAFNSVADVVRHKVPRDAPEWCDQWVQKALQLDPALRPSVGNLLQSVAMATAGDRMSQTLTGTGVAAATGARTPPSHQLPTSAPSRPLGGGRGEAQPRSPPPVPRRGGYGSPGGAGGGGGASPRFS
eukprot:TRINITY_DN1588_c1_g2_i1.p1 TRINITY_DN1588_c1_g2~~TRINITY_DN1588_c1_g2_i1.p1  ORF type:complete len:666 (+),score=180.24 TRINITY_DN1588_c1_g2_i1:141-2138(+)